MQAVKWANEAIEDASLRAAVDKEVAQLSNVRAPSLQGFVAADIATAGVGVGSWAVAMCDVHLLQYEYI